MSIELLLVVGSLSPACPAGGAMALGYIGYRLGRAGLATRGVFRLGDTGGSSSLPTASNTGGSSSLPTASSRVLLLLLSVPLLLAP